jgi:peptidoglycan/LPS O-acetylase OafA/YrhL
VTRLNPDDKPPNVAIRGHLEVRQVESSSFRVVPDAESRDGGSSRLPALDGVRGLGFVFVFLFHAQYLTGGLIGVDIFFVLSGFLITSILLRERIKSGSINLFHFYMRRALRLLPALFAMIGFVIVWTWLYDPDRLAITLRDAQSVGLYYWNFRVLDWLTDAANHQYMFIHLWSLSGEEQFYMVWPVAILAALSIGMPSWAQRAAVVSGIVLPAIARAALWTEPTWFSLYARTDMRVDTLLWGALVSWLVVSGWRPGPRAVAGLQVASPTALLALVVLAARRTPTTRASSASMEGIRPSACVRRWSLQPRL